MATSAISHYTLQIILADKKSHSLMDELFYKVIHLGCIANQRCSVNEFLTGTGNTNLQIPMGSIYSP